MGLLLLFGGGGGGGGGAAAAGLARLYDDLGTVIIRRLGDAGGPRTDRTEAELDNIIAWAKDSPRSFYRDTTTVGNVGAGEDDLHSISIDAGTLAADGDYLTGEGGGRFASNANTKDVRFYVDGTIQAAIQIANGAQGWVLRYKIIRLSSTSVRVNCTLEANVLRVSSAPALTLSTGYAFQANNADETVSDLAANPLVILVTGEATSDNDVTQNLSIVELFQQ